MKICTRKQPTCCGRRGTTHSLDVMRNKDFRSNSTEKSLGKPTTKPGKTLFRIKSTVYDQGLRGHDDGDIADVCRREQRALVTLDLDFSDVRVYPPAHYPG